MSDIASSLFNLAKNNAGKFKSPKQADYLLKHFKDGVFYHSMQHQFGDYDSKTDRNSRTTRFYFEANQDGLQKITKETSKGQELYWENTPQFLALAAGKELERQKAAYRDQLLENASTYIFRKQALPQYQSILKEKTDEHTAFLIAIEAGRQKLLDAGVPDADETMDNIIASSKVTFDLKVAEIQSQIDECNAKINEFGYAREMLSYVDSVCSAYLGFCQSSEGNYLPDAMQSFIETLASFAPDCYKEGAAKSALEAVFNKKSFERLSYGFLPSADDLARGVTSDVILKEFAGKFIGESQVHINPYVPIKEQESPALDSTVENALEPQAVENRPAMR